MKKYLFVAAILLSHACFSLNVVLANEAEDEAAKEAEKLLTLTGTKAAMEQMVDIMLAQQVQQNPNLMPYEHVMREFLAKYLSFESVKADYIAIYTDAFSSNELKAMNIFYSTTVGKKAVKLMPTLIQKGSELGVRRVQENFPELQKMIEAEMKKQKAQKPEQNAQEPQP